MSRTSRGGCFWLHWRQNREDAKGCVIRWQCFNFGKSWQSIRDTALSVCVSMGIRDRGKWGVRKGRRERQRGGEGDTEKCWEFRGEKQGGRGLGELGLTARWVSGRTPRRQVGSCWWRCGWGGAAAESTGRRASLCSPLSGCCSPAACRPTHTNTQDVKLHSSHDGRTHLLSVCAYRTSMLLRPQKAPSIRRLRPFLCILSERRACRPWNARPSTLRTRFLLSSLQHT